MLLNAVILLFSIPGLILGHHSKCDDDQCHLSHDEYNEEQTIQNLTNLLPFLSHVFNSMVTVGRTRYSASLTLDNIVLSLHLLSHYRPFSLLDGIQFFLCFHRFICHTPVGTSTGKALNGTLQPNRDGNQWLFVVNIQDCYLDDHWQGRYAYCCC